MQFFLTTKKVVNVLKDLIPVVLKTDEQPKKDKKTVEILIWNENDYLYKILFLMVWLMTCMTITKFVSLEKRFGMELKV